MPSSESVRYSKVNSEGRTPKGNAVTYTEENNRERIRPFGSLRSVTERTNQDDEENGDVDVEDDFENGSAGAGTQEVKCVGFGGCRRG